MAPRTIRVFLVDDHELVRRGLCDVLANAPDVTVVGEAANAVDAVRDVFRLVPDVVLLDVRLPDGSGIDVCREVRAKEPSVRFLMLTSYDDREALVASLRAGASGFALKQIRGPELLEAVHAVAAGTNVDDIGTPDAPSEQASPAAQASPGAQAASVLQSGDQALERLLASLSGQEGRILAGIVAGLTNREIGDQLGIAEQTVKNHITRLLAKLGVTHRTQAAVLGIEARHRGLWTSPAPTSQESTSRESTSREAGT